MHKMHTIYNKINILNFNGIIAKYNIILSSMI